MYIKYWGALKKEVGHPILWEGGTASFSNDWFTSESFLRYFHSQITLVQKMFVVRPTQATFVDLDRIYSSLVVELMKWFVH